MFKGQRWKVSHSRVSQYRYAGPSPQLSHCEEKCTATWPTIEQTLRWGEEIVAFISLSEIEPRAREVALPSESPASRISDGRRSRLLATGVTLAVPWVVAVPVPD